MSGFYQWRGYPWPHRFEGNGHKPQVEHYAFQGLDAPWATESPYELSKARAGYGDVTTSWVTQATTRQSSEVRYSGQRTPLGTPVSVLTRTGGDMLSAPCGRCGFRLETHRCRCDFEVIA